LEESLLQPWIAFPHYLVGAFSKPFQPKTSIVCQVKVDHEVIIY